MDPHQGPFGLLGLIVGWGSVALAVAAFAVGILVVPRLIRRGESLRWRTHALQALVLLLCTVLGLLATGIWLNRSFVFFGSWADVFDGGGATLATEEYGAAVSLGGASATAPAAGHRTDEDPGAVVSLTQQETAALADARTRPITATQAHPAADGTLTGLRETGEGQYVSARIPAGASGVDASALVYLPAGYLQHPERRYPVILAFSGIPGTPDAWRQAFGVGERVDKAAQEGRLAQAIVVMPAVFPGRLDTECVDPSTPADGAGGTRRAPQNYETWISQDVAGWAREHLRTIEDPHAWATLGYSAGGWCASMISVRHPDLARASISLAGYFRPDYAPGQVWTAPDDPRYDLPALVAREKPPVSMYFFAGGEDVLAKPSIGPMTAAVAAPTSLTVQRTRHGGHLITLWITQLPASLEWLGGHAAGFAPA